MERDDLEDLGIDGRIVQNESSRNGMERKGMDGSGSG
jgi:hypothetical protein